MAIDRDAIRRIKERIDLVEVVAKYVKLERRGDRWWGLSPFKTEKTPSFTVKPADGFYYCFATHKGGDVFTFISEMEGLSFADAVRQAASIVGIEVEEARDDEAERQRAALRELYSRVTGTFQYLLTEDERGRQALDYLAHRGISRRSIDAFRLGYAPERSDWLYRFLRGKSYSDEFLQQSGLFSRTYQHSALFRHRVIFPIIDEREQVRAFGARALSDGQRAKYINSPDTPIYQKKHTLFGLAQALPQMRADRRVIVAEGYIDVIAFHQAGFPAAVAPLGTAFTEEQARLLKRWVDEVVLVFDADAAGLEASIRAAEVAERVGLRCSAAPVTSGKDPGDLLVSGGPAAIGALLEAAGPVFQYLLERLEAVGSDIGREAGDLLLQKLFPYIMVINSEVRREQALDRMADVVGASRVAVQSDFEQWSKGARREAVEEDAAESQPVPISRDLALVLATAQNSELFAHLRHHVSSDSFQDSTARRVFLLLEDAYRHGDAVPRGLINRLNEEPLRDAVLTRLTSGEFDGWTKRDVQSGIERIRERELRDAQRSLDRALRTVDPSDYEEVRRLQQQKMAVDQELGSLKGTKT